MGMNVCVCIECNFNATATKHVNERNLFTQKYSRLPVTGNVPIVCLSSFLTLCLRKQSAHEYLKCVETQNQNLIIIQIQMTRSNVLRSTNKTCSIYASESNQLDHRWPFIFMKWIWHRPMIANQRLLVACRLLILLLIQLSPPLLISMPLYHFCLCHSSLEFIFKYKEKILAQKATSTANARNEGVRLKHPLNYVIKAVFWFSLQNAMLNDGFA